MRRKRAEPRRKDFCRFRRLLLEVQLAKPNMTELGNGFAGLHIEALAQASCSKAGEICTSVGGLILDMQIRRSGASEVSANFRTCSFFLPRQAGRIENNDISEGVA